MQVTGVVVRGYGVASGIAGDPRFPRGTLALQVPLSRQFGLDLTDCFIGTINVDISPREYVIEQPDFRFDSVLWSPDLPAETFSFCRCRLVRNATEHRAWIYYPHPETKPEHFQTPSVMEIMAPKIIDLTYGDEVALQLDSNAIAFR